jgi:Tfp pilus assembly protein PilX
MTLFCRPANPRFSSRRVEGGVILLIALFALLLISAAATALILMAGTETAVDANYRSSTQAFYAAYAGLEEGRGRLSSSDPGAFGAFIAQPGGVLAPGQVRYVLNPSPGEAVDPTNLSSGNPYADFEYQKEWGVAVTGAAVQTTVSTAAQAGLLGPQYKWVRITATTEQSSGIDVNGDGSLDSVTPLCFDGANEYLRIGGGSCQQTPSGAGTGNQVFTITSLAVLPGGSRRLLEDQVAMTSPKLSFPAAVTLDGNGAGYAPPNSEPFYMNGNDRQGSNPFACGLPSQPALPAIGTVNTTDASTIAGEIPQQRQPHYVGSGGSPSVQDIVGSLPTGYQSVASLDGPGGLTETLAAAATQVVGPPLGTNNLSTTYSSLPSYGSAAQPLITVVNGNLNLSGGVTGYGLLLVTGTLTISGTVGWRGAVLDIGQGAMTVSGGGSNELDGAVLVAKTRDTSNALLASLGAPSLNWNGGGGNGIYYDSCWLADAFTAMNDRVLAFREIAE